MRRHLSLPAIMAAALVVATMASLGAIAELRSAARSSGAASQATETPFPTATIVDTTMPTQPPATTPPPSSTPGSTPTPHPIFMPAGIRDERCDPVEEHVDVMFVLDGSSYMNALHSGKKSFEIAKTIINQTLDAMDFAPNAAGQKDQVGIIMFRNSPAPDPTEMQVLTSDVAGFRAFVAGLSLGEKPRNTTRMDTALLIASDWVRDGDRHLAKNKPILIFISELQAKNVPYKNEPGCEEKDENCTMLKRAKEVKDAGVTLVVFATDDGNRGSELLAMASAEALAFVRPTADQIKSTIAKLAPRVPCPSSRFWPFRP